MIDPLVPILGLALVAMAVAWLLARAGLPGAAIVAGLLVGSMSGPDVLGRVAPETWLDWFRGGSEARSQLEGLDRIEALGTAAGTAAGIEDPVVEFPDSSVDPAFDSPETLRQDLEDAERRHRRSSIWSIALMAGLLIATAVREGVAGWRRSSGRHGDALLLGAWVAVLPAGLGMALLHSAVVGAGMDSSKADWALLLSIASSLAIGPWCLSRGDVERASASEPGGAALVLASGLVATGLAVAAMATGTVLGASAWPIATVASAMVLGGILGAVRADSSSPASPSGTAGGSPGNMSASRRALTLLVAPMVAIAMLDISPSRNFAWWPVIVAAILTADGRYLGAVIAGIMPGTRRGLRAMRLLMPLTAVGPMQASVASVASVSGALPPEFALALLVGAALPEVTAPMRARTDRQLREAEALSEALSEESTRERSDR